MSQNLLCAYDVQSTGAYVLEILVWYIWQIDLHYKKCGTNLPPTLIEFVSSALHHRLVLKQKQKHICWSSPCDGDTIQPSIHLENPPILIDQADIKGIITGHNRSNISTTRVHCIKHYTTPIQTFFPLLAASRALQYISIK